MSVIVKGMDMPKSCNRCRLRFLTPRGMCACRQVADKPVKVEDYRNARHPDCPCVELPTPHGRLIDENDVIKLLEQVAMLQRGERQKGTLSIINKLKNSPTIIEAEE